MKTSKELVIEIKEKSKNAPRCPVLMYDLEDNFIKESTFIIQNYNNRKARIAGYYYKYVNRLVNDVENIDQIMKDFEIDFIESARI